MTAASQRKASEWTAAIEAAANKLKVSNSDIRLAAGEITANEMRTVRAIIEWMDTRIRALRRQPSEPDEARDYKSLYFDLIMQVAKKHPGEDRHATAKRYIEQAENNSDNRPQQGGKRERTK